MRTILAILLLASPALAAEPVVNRDLAYAEPTNEKQTLDVYASTEGKDHPIVFWVHGGGWEKGDKADVQIKPQAFVDKGFVFVSVNYRLLPEASIKQMAGDVAKAIRWTCDHAKDYGGVPTTIFVGGHSAGAQLAALVCTDDEYLMAEGLSLSIIKGCVPVDGDTYDVPLQIATEPATSAESHAKKFGSAQDQKELSPVTHIAKGESIPAFLILHVADNPLTRKQAQRLYLELRPYGFAARVVAAEGKTHGTINSDLGLPDDKPTQELWAFLDETLKTPKKPRRRMAPTSEQLSGALKKEISLGAPRITFEQSIDVLGTLIGANIVILGEDLQLLGITKHQSLGLDEYDKPADEVLRKILKKMNPDGQLVYIFRNGTIAITTRAAVERRGDELPD